MYARHSSLISSCPLPSKWASICGQQLQFSVQTRCPSSPNPSPNIRNTNKSNNQLFIAATFHCHPHFKCNWCKCRPHSYQTPKRTPIHKQLSQTAPFSSTLTSIMGRALRQLLGFHNSHTFRWSRTSSARSSSGRERVKRPLTVGLPTVRPNAKPIISSTSSKEWTYWAKSTRLSTVGASRGKSTVRSDNVATTHTRSVQCSRSTDTFIRCTWPRSISKTKSCSQMR